MSDELSDTNIFIDLIEPKFDSTHEVSRAMVEYNRSIRGCCKTLAEEHEKSIDKIGTAIFNRKVWATESSNDHDKGLLGNDHFLFTNLSGKFELKPDNYSLFNSLFRSINTNRPYSDTEGQALGNCPINSDENDNWFDGLYREDWNNYLEKLNEIYNDNCIRDHKYWEKYFFRPINNCLCELMGGEQTFRNAFSDKPEELEGKIKKVLASMVELLTMPVLGQFPGTMSRILEKESEANEAMAFLAFSTNKGKHIGYYPLRQGLVSKEHFKIIEQQKTFGEFGEQGKRESVENDKIATILTKLTQMYVRGFEELNQTIFLSVPVHRTYYSRDYKDRGTVVGFLKGWVFIPIILKVIEGSKDHIYDRFSRNLIKQPKSLKTLIQTCFSTNNVLVECVRGAAARRAVEGANVDTNDLVALSGSLHHLTGWKISQCEGAEEEKLGNEIKKRDQWRENDTVKIRLGNRLKDGGYEVDDGGKVIHLTKSDESFIEPLDDLWSEVSDIDIYLFDMAQRIRTVHALILDKQAQAREEANTSMSIQEQNFAHELGQVTGLLGNKYVVSQQRANEILGKIPTENAEVIRAASKIILAPKLFEAAKNYIYIWAPPKTEDLSFMHETDVDRFLNNVKQKVHSAGLANRLKNLPATSFHRHEDTIKKYEENLELLVYCQKELKFRFFDEKKEDRERSMRLLFRIVAAGTLNAIQHASSNGKVHIIGSEDSIWIVNSIREGREVEELYSEREDGDGTLKVLRSLWRRIPVLDLQPPRINMGLLSNENPPQLPLIKHLSEWPVMFKIRIQFSSGYLKVEEGL